MKRLINLTITTFAVYIAVVSLRVNIITEDIGTTYLNEIEIITEAVSSSVANPRPNVSAAGYLLMDASNNRVLISSNEHKELPVASTTKIMTTLLALEQPNLNEGFIVGGEVVVEGSNMGLSVGDTVSLNALSVGLMLESGNDAANAVAKHIAGSEEAFSDMMNERAEQLGMKNTYFTTPSGLDKGGNHSTAYDMAVLMSEAIKNEEFLNITSSQKRTIYFGTPPEAREMYNHNKLLANYQYAIGGKTGYTEKAGRCLVSVAKKDGITLVFVTLDAYDDFNTHELMYEWAFSHLEYESFNDYIDDAHLNVVGSDVNSIALTASKELGAFMLKDESVEVSIQIILPSFEYAPVGAHEVVGEVLVFKEDILLTSSPLVTTFSAERAEIGAIESIIEKILDFTEKTV